MTIDPTSDAIRDELPREVLSYAEGLRRQMYEIARKYGVEKPADIGPKIASGEVSLEDMQRMVELKELLEATVKEKKIPRSAARAMEERQAEWDAAFAKGLETIGEALDLGEARDAAFDRSKPYLYSRQLEMAVDALPLVPFEQIIADDRFVENLAKRMKEYAFEVQSRESLGMVACLIANRSIRAMPEAMRALVTQNVDGNGMVGLGYQWAGGTLNVIGDAGAFLGTEMSGGTVVANSIVGSFAGARMSGGELIISNSIMPNDVGTEMSGGKIKISSAGDNLGKDMRGGSIVAIAAGDSVGYGMIDGEIEIERAARDYLGLSMRGGRIKAHDAGLSVGILMSGGRIEVSTAGDDLGMKMRGGTILVGSCKNAGRNMFGGEILISGRVGEIIAKRTGGTIRYIGPFAWWKNLFV